MVRKIVVKRSSTLVHRLPCLIYRDWKLLGVLILGRHQDPKDRRREYYFVLANPMDWPPLKVVPWTQPEFALVEKPSG